MRTTHRVEWWAEGGQVPETDNLSIVALLRYADSCPPERHPDCPHVRQHEMGRTCEKECRSLLQLMLRPRSTAPPSLAGCFDAKQALLVSRKRSEEPTEEWSTSALLAVLRDVAKSRAITTSGGIELRRMVDGTDALALVEHRGIDTQLLLSSALAELVSTSLDVTMAAVEFMGGKEWAHWAHWNALRTSYPSPDQSTRRGISSDVLHLNEQFRSAVEKWISEANPADVLMWVPPEQLGAGRSREERRSTSGGLEEHSWLFERLTVTYLADWSDRSLKMEYRFLTTTWKPETFPIQLLAERDERPESVAAEIASRAVSIRIPRLEGIEALTEQALTWITEGRRDLAAALFAAACITHPEDPNVLNNHGFCLLLDEPGRAFSRFEEAVDAGGDDSLVRLNIICSLVLLGKKQEALGRAEIAFPTMSVDVAYQWTLPLTSDSSVATVSLRQYLCQLMIQVSEQEGLADERERWQARLDTIEPSVIPH
jgi:hypothetical protein